MKTKDLQNITMILGLCAVVVAILAFSTQMTSAANEKFYINTVDGAFTANETEVVISSVQVLCDVGDKAVAGGYELLSQQVGVAILTDYANAPLLNSSGFPEGWTVSAANFDGAPFPVRVYATCTRLD